MDKEEQLRNCKQKIHTEFWNYDTTVDVVSCLEHVFSEYKIFGAYFDRFPAAHNNLRPDFTVSFGEDYGILGEIKRTFPMDEKNLINGIRQLKLYDSMRNYKFKSGENKYVAPKTVDILLAIHHDNSNVIFSRINKLINTNKNFNFNHNLIFIAYNMSEVNLMTRYSFTKYAGENRDFRDSPPLNGSDRLDAKFATSDILVYIQDFMYYKIKGIFCNDDPPPIFTTVILWNQFFYEYLKPNEKKSFRRGTTQHKISINIDINELCKRMNDYLRPKSHVRIGWIRNSINFLEEAGLAKKIDDDHAIVYYFNPTTEYGEKKYIQNKKGEYKRFKEYARIFADYYCRYKIEDYKKKSIKQLSKKKSEQKKLF